MSRPDPRPSTWLIGTHSSNPTASPVRSIGPKEKDPSAHSTTRSGSTRATVRLRTERPAANRVVASVGSRGDSYHNVMAESIVRCLQAHLDRNRGFWKGLDDLKLATLEWVDWFNHRRIFHELGRIPSAEHETRHYLRSESNHQAEIRTAEPA